MSKHGNKSTPPTMKYWGAILGIGICLTVAAICFIIGINKYSQGVDVTVFFIIGVVSAAIVPFLNKIQLKLRDEVEYDEFGRSRKHGDFSKLSGAERKEIERQKMAEAETILPSSEIKAFTKKGSKTPEEDISKLIGLPQVKKMMQDLAARMEYDKQYNKKNKNNADAKSYHMCFFGPPGTGKTTVARIIAGLLYKYDVIRENKCIEVDGNFFHSSGTQKATQKTKMVIQNAIGGVLFIDEAYALVPDNNSGNREVVATLIKEMEDNRDDIVIILAGYEHEMNALIDTNPGFKSRIQHYYNFTPYSIEDLKKIFTKMSKDNGYEISEVAYDRFEELIEPMMKMRDFGNGRTVRNIVQESIDKHKVNCIVEFKNKKPANKKEEDEKNERLKTLTYEDICSPKIF